MENITGGECWMSCSFVIEANCQHCCSEKGNGYSTYNGNCVMVFVDTFSIPLIKVKI